MKNFNTFIRENYEPIQDGELGKLMIEIDDSEYDEEWKFSLTLEKTWKQFSDKTITLLDFNNIYATTLVENQQQISAACGDAAWNSIEPIAVDELRKATTTEESEKIYDKLYDVYDKYEIKIDTGNLEEFISENAQSYAIGDIILVDFYGEQVTAKITKIPTKNSYLIQIEENTTFLPKEHQINASQIINTMTGNDAPANKSDWNQTIQQRPSNDLAINGAGTPGVPATGKSTS